MSGPKLYFYLIFYNLNIENFMWERESEREREIDGKAKEEGSVGPPDRAK